MAALGLGVDIRSVGKAGARVIAAAILAYALIRVLQLGCSEANAGIRLRRLCKPRAALTAISPPPRGDGGAPVSETS